MRTTRLAIPIGFSVALLGLFFVIMQTRILPPDGWITGDQGSKFLQTRAFALNGPFHPGIEVLAHDVDPDYRQQEPKLDNRGGLLVSEFLWLLPLITAPFYAALGLHGLYVIPALSVLVIFVAAAALGRRMGDARGLITAWIAVAATPVLFYGVELWEHAPAAACVIVAAVLLAPEDRPTSRSRLFGAGAAVAIGSLFREEVVATIPALLFARALLPGPAIARLLRDGLLVGAGAAAVFLAAVPMNLVMYGSPLPTHITQDAWDVVKTTPYVAMRGDIVRSLLLPQRRLPVFLAAVVVGLMGAAGRRWSEHAVWLVHGAVLLLLALLVGAPLLRIVLRLPQGPAYVISSAAHTWPFALALFYVPWITRDDNRQMTRFLLVGAVSMIAIITLIVPMDGGGQWSPRFYLAAAPLLAVVTASAFRPIVARTSIIRTAIASAVVMGSVAMQAHGLQFAWQAKTGMSRLTALVADNTTPQDVLISNLFWFPEVTSTLAHTRRMLFTQSYFDIPATVAVTRQRGYRHVTIVGAPTLANYQPPDAFDPPIVPCHLERKRVVPLPFNLTLNEYRCPGE